MIVLRLSHVHNEDVDHLTLINFGGGWQGNVIQKHQLQ
jgi:hypothetical protein